MFDTSLMKRWYKVTCLQDGKQQRYCCSNYTNVFVFNEYLMILSLVPIFMYNKVIK